MRPIKMELCGWGPYREKQEIDFEKLSQRGLFLVTGDTGAGKTTIFDAITYALFGDMSGQVREKNSVRSDFADENTPTYVELTMQHRGEVYHICRRPEYMRPKKRKTGNAEYIKEKEYALLTMSDNDKVEGSVAVTRKVQEILGMDIRQFRQISMIAQGEFAKLLTASPKEKMQIFRDIFGTTFFEKFAGLLRSRQLELYRTLQMYTHKIDEDIDSFQCQEETWLELKNGEERLPEAVCAYLSEKEAAEKKEKKRLTAALEQTEKELEKSGAEWGELERLLKAWSEAVALEKEREKTTIFYEKREVLKKWLLLTEKRIEEQSKAELAEKAVKRAAAGLEQAQEAYKKAEKTAAQKREQFARALTQYRSAAVGIAASMLQEGQPCPVCGSVEHPQIAEQTKEHPDENTLKRLQTEQERAEAASTDAYGKALAEKKELEHRLEQQKEEKEKLDDVEIQYAAVRQECGKEVLEQLLSGSREGILTAVQLRQLEQRLEKAVETYQRAVALLEEKRKTAEESLRRLGLSEIEEAEQKEQQLLELRREQQLEKNRISESLKRNYALLENAARIRKSLLEKIEEMKEIRQEYGIVKDLDNLTSGNNPKRLVFEQYVLAGYFEEILQEANRRLSRMTSGRFELYRVEEIGDGRSKDNLEIRVLDNYTGKYRSVKTLSGGETFKASLALALGLSDVIQRRSGGICVECLFIDEGFGALDGESLEQACQTLRTLVSGDCMIGIISHVSQLREQIENRLLVKRTNRGSFVEFS